MEAMGTQQNSLGFRTRHDVYEIRPRKDREGFDLVSDLFRHDPIWYAGPDAVRIAVAYAKHRSWSRSHRAIIRVLDDSGAVIQTHESVGDFRQFQLLEQPCDPAGFDFPLPVSSLPPRTLPKGPIGSGNSTV
jgi:hypothetical protein